MTSLRSTASLLVPALVLAACTTAESPLSPPVNGVRSSLSIATPDGYVVNFKNDNIPASFATRVAALGGTVTASFDGAGLAVVNGISETAAESLSDFGDVAPDMTVQLDPR